MISRRPAGLLNPGTLLRQPRVRLVGLLLAANLLAGLLWAAWSPPRSNAIVVGSHRFLGVFDIATIYPFDDEAWAAADGRFAILMAILGVTTALFAWRLVRIRGPFTIAVLAAAGLVGSLLAGFVGFLVGGGDLSGAKNDTIQLALTVHSQALYVLQPLIFVVIYGLFAGFATNDDLGVGIQQAVPLVGAEGQA